MIGRPVPGPASPTGVSDGGCYARVGRGKLIAILDKAGWSELQATLKPVHDSPKAEGVRRS